MSGCKGERGHGHQKAPCPGPCKDLCQNPSACQDPCKPVQHCHEQSPCGQKKDPCNPCSPNPSQSQGSQHGCKK